MQAEAERDAVQEDEDPGIATAARSRRDWRLRLVTFAKLLVGIVLLGVIIHYLAPSWQEIRESIDFRPGYVFVAIAGTGVATAVGAVRWRILAELMGGGRLPYAIYFHNLALTRLIGQFSSVAFMDTVGRGVVMRGHGRSGGPRLGHHLGALLVERLLDLVLPMAMMAWAVFSVRSVGEISPWVSLTLLCLAFAAGAVPLLGPATRVAGGLMGWIQRLRGRTTSVAPLAVSYSVAAWITVLSLTRYLCVVAQFYGIGAAAGLGLDSLTMAYATPASQLAAFAGITPGGLGVQDAGWAGALHWLGYSGPIIAAFLLTTRVLVVFNFAVLSLGSLPFAQLAQRTLTRS